MNLEQMCLIALVLQNSGSVNYQKWVEENLMGLYLLLLDFWLPLDRVIVFSCVHTGKPSKLD